jgi:uncharacterized FlaG/YvyC family protein
LTSISPLFGTKSQAQNLTQKQIFKAQKNSIKSPKLRHSKKIKAQSCSNSTLKATKKRFKRFLSRRQGVLAFNETKTLKSYLNHFRKYRKIQTSLFNNQMP